MTEKSPYQVLGISEDASFEEVQAAKQRLLDESMPDERQQERIEQAYDMILMQRLRLRKEGKIAVPDRIRYAEPAVAANPAVLPPPSRKPQPWAAWIERWIDTPNWTDIWLPLGIFGGLALWVHVQGSDSPSLQLGLGLLVSIYFLYRKERRFLRSVALGFLGLLVGGAIAYGITSAVAGPEPGAIWLAGITLIVMWIVTSYFR